MGSRMAANLQKDGRQLVVYNRTPEKAADLVANGAILAESPAVVAEQVDLLFTMLAHPQAVEEMALGENGFLDSLDGGALWADCSTVTPSFSRRMAAEADGRGIRFMDSPVAGSKNQAAQAQLTFIVGSAVEDLEECRPYFEVMGSRILHVGPVGMGISLKVVINSQIAMAMVAFSEGVALGKSLGIPQDFLFNILLGGPVVAPALSGKRPKFEQDNYEDVEFPLRWIQKDLQMATVAAYETGSVMPLANAAKEIYRLADQKGLGDLDYSAVFKFLQTV
jgi:3-hydroxyisobutyrate dehydrogenase/glyoxylate/succinic semialdehyde reductase